MIDDHHDLSRYPQQKEQIRGSSTLMLPAILLGGLVNRANRIQKNGRTWFLVYAALHLLFVVIGVFSISLVIANEYRTLHGNTWSLHEVWATLVFYDTVSWLVPVIVAWAALLLLAARCLRSGTS